jgi:hypothetical protein
MGDPFFSNRLRKNASERNGAEIVVVASLIIVVEKLVHKEALKLQSAEGMQIHVTSLLSLFCSLRA